MLKLIRINSWWNTIVPQVLGWIYFYLLTDVIRIQRERPGLMHDYIMFYADSVKPFCTALVAIAAFGYLFNDLCDIESDSKGGKPNRLGELPGTWRIVVVAVPLLIGLYAWVDLNFLYATANWTMRLANIFFIAQVLTLIMYSARPFRMKERAELGIAFDTFYGHLNPVLITLLLFQVYPSKGYWFYSFMFLVILVCSVKGIRNILLHQIEDRKKDEAAGLNTAVIKYGPWRIINFINHYLFPVEVFFLVCLMIVMSIHIPPLIIPLIFFAIISYLKMSGWKIGYADRRLLEFKFTYFMNDFYEGWLPVFMLIILSVYRHEFVFLLILHLVLFPNFIIKLVKDIKKIRENFKIEEDY